MVLVIETFIIHVCILMQELYFNIFKKPSFCTTQILWNFICSLLVHSCETLSGIIYITNLISAEASVSNKESKNNLIYMILYCITLPHITAVLLLYCSIQTKNSCNLGVQGNKYSNKRICKSSNHITIPLCLIWKNGGGIWGL